MAGIYIYLLLVSLTSTFHRIAVLNTSPVMCNCGFCTPIMPKIQSRYLNIIFQLSSTWISFQCTHIRWSLVMTIWSQASLLTIVVWIEPRSTLWIRNRTKVSVGAAPNGHQQKIIPSRVNGSVTVDALPQSRPWHPGGGSLHARRQYHASHCISPSYRGFTVSSRSVCLPFFTNTLALWPTETICWNGFIR